MKRLLQSILIFSLIVASCSRTEEEGNSSLDEWRLETGYSGNFIFGRTSIALISDDIKHIEEFTFEGVGDYMVFHIRNNSDGNINSGKHLLNKECTVSPCDTIVENSIWGFSGGRNTAYGMPEFDNLLLNLSGEVDILIENDVYEFKFNLEQESIKINETWKGKLIPLN